MSADTIVLKSEVSELRSAFITMAEVLILFQEFIEKEFGDMSDFKDSGSYTQLVEIFNKLRVGVSAFSGVQNPGMKTLTNLENNSLPLANDEDKRLSLNELAMDGKLGLSLLEADDEEQIEVDVDFDEDVGFGVNDEGDYADEITITKVYSVASPSASATTTLTNSISSLQQGKAVSSPIAEKVAFEEQQQQYLRSRPALPILGQNNMPRHASFVLSNLADVSNVDDEQNSETPMNLVVAKSSSTGVPFAPVSSRRSRGENRREKWKGKGTTKATGKPKMTTLKKGKPTQAAITNLGKRRRSDIVKCPVCFKGYSSKGVLSRHIKEAHRTEPQFPCFYCPLKFKNGPLRLDHMHNAHPVDFNSVVCPYCGRKSTSATGKRNHMMICARKTQAEQQGNRYQPQTRKRRCSARSAAAASGSTLHE